MRATRSNIDAKIIITFAGANMPYLTKSRFKLAIECPTKLKYLDDPQFANSMSSSELLRALAEAGHQVGALAKFLFPGGEEIDLDGHESQLRLSRERLAQENCVLYEAAFSAENLFVRVDILKKLGNRLELYEVKSKGFDPTDGSTKLVGKKGQILSEYKSYLYDIAFQKYVVQKCYPEMEVVCHLIMPNKAAPAQQASVGSLIKTTRVGRSVRVNADESLRDGKIASSLLCVLATDEYVERLLNEPVNAGGRSYAFEESIEAFSIHLAEASLPPRAGQHCRSCEFRLDETSASTLKDGRVTCWEEQFGKSKEISQSRTILELYSLNAARTAALLSQGKFAASSVAPEDLGTKEEADKISLSHRQWMQCEEAKGDRRVKFVPSVGLRKLLSGFRFPLHFVDFETARPTLPLHAGVKPFEQLLYQFSHHRLEADGRLFHASQYLFEYPGEFPNFSTLRHLKNALSTDAGTIFHWWDHERTVLSEVKTQLESSGIEEVPDRDDLIEFVNSLTNRAEGGQTGRLVDLGRHVFHQHFFFPGTGGSSSIKRALPAILAQGILDNEYGSPTYGSKDGPASLNFVDHQWIRKGDDGIVIDPYLLLGERFNDGVLAGSEQVEDDEFVSNGGAAMIAYYLLEDAELNQADRVTLRGQLLKYCELDTLAMVMVWQAVNKIVRGG